MKRMMTGLLVALLLLGLISCAPGDALGTLGDPFALEVLGDPTGIAPEDLAVEPEKELDTSAITINAQLVGISLPSTDLERWNRDGESLQRFFLENDMIPLVEYAQNDSALQFDQVTDMLLQGCKVLIIAAVDDQTLESVLEIAQVLDIAVIAYDRPIYHDSVDFYVSFDSYRIGVMQAEFLCEQLQLEEADGPFYIELFAGAPEDHNSTFLYEGALSVLQPYLDTGKLQVRSKQTKFEEIAMQDWSGELARGRMAYLIEQYEGTQTRLDAVLSPNDSIAAGIIEALQAQGVTAMPLITGQDCDILAVQHLVAGRQSMSIFKDTRLLAAQAAKTALALSRNELPQMNGALALPGYDTAVLAYYCEPILTTVENYEPVLLHSSYYTYGELGLGE